MNIYFIIIILLLLIIVYLVKKNKENKNTNNLEFFDIIAENNSSNNLINIPEYILSLNLNFYYKNDLSSEKLVILTSHYKEDLFWLHYIHYPFIISSKTVSAKTLYVPINKGDEVSAYLNYIIKYYNNLPEYTLFLHGHYEDWHQKNNLVNIINNLKFNKEYENINTIGIDDRDIKSNIYLLFLKTFIWNELFREELGEMPDKFYDKCCAQFIVNRRRIRLRSLKFYQKILDYINNHDDAKKDPIHGKMGYYMEFIWHYIFGEKAYMDLDKSVRETETNNKYIYK